MSMNNLQLKSTDSKCGPYACRSVAIEAAKKDPLSLASGIFTLIKCHGSYDYVSGSATVLMSSDIPMADYFLNLHGEWMHTTRGRK